MFVVGYYVDQVVLCLFYGLCVCIRVYVFRCDVVPFSWYVYVHFVKVDEALCIHWQFCITNVCNPLLLIENMSLL